MGLPNATFLRTRIEFTSSFFAPGEVNEIWLTFPDPQMKRKREKMIRSAGSAGWGPSSCAHSR